MPHESAEVSGLLKQLARSGIEWSDVARIVGTTVPQLNQWQTGQAAPRVALRILVELVVFLDLLHDVYGVPNPVIWLEVLRDLSGGCRIRLMELYRSNDRHWLIAIAAGHRTVEDVLDQVEQGWRSRSFTTFELTAGSDGRPTLRRKVSG